MGKLMDEYYYNKLSEIMYFSGGIVDTILILFFSQIQRAPEWEFCRHARRFEVNRGRGHLAKIVGEGFFLLTSPVDYAIINSQEASATVGGPLQGVKIFLKL